MSLLSRERFHARTMLRLGACFFDLAVTDRFEARGFFLATLLFGATRLFFGAEATLFGFTC